MSAEAELIITVWDAVRDHVAASKRPDLAKEVMYAFAEYGFDASDLADVGDEDTDLEEAFNEVYGDEISSQEEDESWE